MLNPMTVVEDDAVLTQTSARSGSRARARETRKPGSEQTGSAEDGRAMAKASEAASSPRSLTPVEAAQRWDAVVTLGALVPLLMSAARFRA
jgi:hypothetical protein